MASTSTTTLAPLESPFISMESRPPSPVLPSIMTGSALANEISRQESRLPSIALPPLSPGRYPASPPSTPPLSGFSKEYQAFVYSKGLAAQQQQQGYNSVQEGSTEDVQAEKDRILYGQGFPDKANLDAYTPASTGASPSSQHLLPSHMQRTAPRSALSRAPFLRQQTPQHTVSFADDVGQAETAPSTPKGHPLGSGSASGLAGYVALEKRLKQVESGRMKLMGYLGASESESKRGKIYRPTQYSHTLALAPLATTSHKFRTTVSRLARVPRKYRSIFGAVVLFTLLLTVLLRSTGQSALDKEMASKRYASGLQKAFVITDTERDVARHADFHLDPNEMDQAKDAQLLDAMQAEDIADAAQDTQFVPTTAHDEAGYEFKFASKKEEMAALVSFLTSTSSNALPPVDPSKSLDPQLVLEFDYTKVETARDDMAQLTEDVFALFPVIVVGRMRDPKHRDILRTMSMYTSNPPPLIIEVDQRQDAETLVPLLGRLLGKDELPQVVVMGAAAGGHAAIQKLQDDGELKAYFAKLGVDMKDKKMKKKPKYIKDAERREKERILGPKPIVPDA